MDRESERAALTFNDTRSSTVSQVANRTEASVLMTTKLGPQLCIGRSPLCIEVDSASLGPDESALLQGGVLPCAEIDAPRNGSRMRQEPD